ncbi:hypothetical protein SCA6_020014 [Theobroma cacao]
MRAALSIYEGINKRPLGFFSLQFSAAVALQGKSSLAGSHFGLPSPSTPASGNTFHHLSLPGKPMEVQKHLS